MSDYHNSVLPTETLEFLAVKPDGIYVDATLGGGGHTGQILKAVRNGRVLAFDQDAQAIEQGKLLQKDFPQLELIQSNFANLTTELHKRNIEQVDGVLFDLGVSSHQLDDLARGFSWKEDCPLDMRMDQSQEKDARVVLNTYPESRLADIIYQYGEERFSRQIAAKIVEMRKQQKFMTTGQLRESVFQSIFGTHQNKINSVSRVFQAIRIEVNAELSILADSFKQAYTLLAPGGRLVVISFHSLEDRIAKNVFRELAKPDDSDFNILTKKPIIAGDAETALNPRARSAKLRAGQKNG